MCGRYTLASPGDEVASLFELAAVARFSPRYNIAPTQPVPVVRLNADGQRELVNLRWGLVPAWAKNIDIGSRLINARSETVAEKPSFRAALKKRRCLVVADGFYEWKKVGNGKQPHYFRRRDRAPFAMAGLWERWEKGGEPLETCTLLTTEANAVVKPVHHRMPVILSPEKHSLWLDTSVGDQTALQPLLVPYNPDSMEGVMVSKTVNNPQNDSPDCVVPA